MDIALLGPLTVRAGQRSVPVRGAPQRLLLARLALAAPRAVADTDLLDLLWPHDPPANAVGNLHSYLSRLRRAVGADLLARDAAGYRLCLDGEHVDIGRAEALARQAREARDTDPRRAVRALESALALWRGQALSGLPDRPALEPDRVRLAGWRRQLREEWFELRLATAPAGDVLPELEQAAVEDPLWERVHLLLMRARHGVGRTAEALALADRYRRRLADEHGIDPGPELVSLRQRLLRGDGGPREEASPSTTARIRHGAPRALPAVTGRFLGRRAELQDIANALAAHRVVTVSGAGGIGKTRTTLELLRGRDGPAPAYVAELAEVPASGQTAAVAAAVATVLGVRAAPEGHVHAVADRLGTDPALLVLDNCEHVLAAARGLVAELLARCPGARILATSRRPLGLAGERVVQLGPLAEDEQVALFRDRAALRRADFPLTEGTRDLVTAICRRLDGLPLALELAARRESVFGLRQLHDRLAAGLDVLEPADGGDRSTAVTAMVEWSYRLLDPDARHLLDRLAVCHGGFTLAALDFLAPAGVANAAALLAELVDASLVGCDLSVEPPRYRLLEVVRHVCHGHLTPQAHTAAAHAHAEWMREEAERIHARQRERSPEAVPLLRREAANLRQALSWLAGTGRWDEAAELAVLVALALSDDPDIGLVAELAAMVPAEENPHSDADALRAVAAGAAAWIGGETGRADRLLTRALGSLPPGHPQRWIARFFRLVNALLLGAGDIAEADAEQLRHDPGAPAWVVATGVCCAALGRLFTGDAHGADGWLTGSADLLAEVEAVDGFVAYTRGELAAAHDPERALAWFEQGYRQCDARAHTYNREVAAIGGAAVLIRLGRNQEAAQRCHRLIGSLRDLGMWPQLWTTLRLSAELLANLGDRAAAARLLAAADADPLAPPVLGAERDRYAELRERAGVPPPDPRHDQAGQRLTRRAVAGQALRALAGYRSAGPDGQATGNRMASTGAHGGPHDDNTAH